ncbi:hypothetical protein [Niallia sp. 03190]
MHKGWMWITLFLIILFVFSVTGLKNLYQVESIKMDEMEEGKCEGI